MFVPSGQSRAKPVAGQKDEEGIVKKRTIAMSAVYLLAGAFALAAQQQPKIELHEFRDDSGVLQTFTTAGSLDLENPFFKSLGTNGRTCNSCHKEENGWGISLKAIRDTFDRTGGLDPLFAAVDGTNSPNVDQSTAEKRRAASSMLLDRGVIRIGLPVPPTAEFVLLNADDPYGFASAGELSLFRRPPPIANLRFQATIFIDGRENFAHPGVSVPGLLAFQANEATLGHAQAARPLTDLERQQMVDFEVALFSAQIRDDNAGRLDAAEAAGGPEPLVTAPFFIGINDPFGGNPTHEPFNSHVFSTFDSWARFDDGRNQDNEGRAAARAAVFRGQELFNSRPIRLTGVSGINDVLGVPVFNGFCTTCHDTPSNGNHSISGPVDIGLTTAALRQPDEPLYTFMNKTTGQTFQTTDPGRGVVTGLWSQLGRMKAPSLRSLAARAPYFHNGAAKSLLDVVNFYNDRFTIGLTENEKQDIVAFLRSL